MTWTNCLPEITCPRCGARVGRASPHGLILDVPGGATVFASSAYAQVQCPCGFLSETCRVPDGRLTLVPYEPAGSVNAGARQRHHRAAKVRPARPRHSRPMNRRTHFDAYRESR